MACASPVSGRLGVILAAGRGRRFGGILTKATVSLGNETLLERCIDCISHTCSAIVIVTNSDAAASVWKLCNDITLQKAEPQLLVVDTETAFASLVFAVQRLAPISAPLIVGCVDSIWSADVSIKLAAETLEGRVGIAIAPVEQVKDYVPMYLSPSGSLVTRPVPGAMPAFASAGCISLPSGGEDLVLRANSLGVRSLRDFQAFLTTSFSVLPIKLDWAIDVDTPSDLRRAQRRLGF